MKCLLSILFACIVVTAFGRVTYRLQTVPPPSFIDDLRWVPVTNSPSSKKQATDKPVPKSAQAVVPALVSMPSAGSGFHYRPIFSRVYSEVGPATSSTSNEAMGTNAPGWVMSFYPSATPGASNFIISGYSSGNYVFTNGIGTATNVSLPLYAPKPPAILQFSVVCDFFSETFLTVTNPQANLFFRVDSADVLAWLDIQSSADCQNWKSGYALVQWDGDTNDIELVCERLQ